MKIPRWAVLTILAAGLGLRLWGIRFARTTPLGRPDEEVFVIEAMGMFNRAYRLLDLGFPEGFFRVWQLLIRLELAVLQSIYGHLNPACLFALNPNAIILPARVFSAVAGTATAGITGLVAGRLAPEHQVAATLWGMAVYAANYLVGRDGHFGVSDATLCLGIALTLLMCVRAAEESPKWLLGAAAFAGLSFGVKASAAGLVVPCVSAAVVSIVRHGRRAIPFALVAPVVALAAFLAVSPRVMVEWGTFIRGLQWSRGERYGGLADPLSSGLFYFPGIVLPAAFGIPGFFAAVYGMGIVIRRRWGAGAVIGLYVIAFWLVLLSPLTRVFVRYASPLVPALAATTAVLAADLWHSLGGLPSRALGGAARFGLIVLLLGPPLVRLLQFDVLSSRPDTRDQAAAWLKEHAGADARVLSEGRYSRVQAIEPKQVEACTAVVPPSLRTYVPMLARSRDDFVDLVNQGKRGWEELTYRAGQYWLHHDADQRQWVANPAASDAPDLVIQPVGPSTMPHGGTERPDASCFEQVHQISPGDLERPRWDVNDAYYVPFTGLGQVSASGPEIFIHRNKCKRP